MFKLLQFPGFCGILVGISLHCVAWFGIWLALKGDEFIFDARGEQGAFEPFLSKYLDIAKFVAGLASGSIVLLVGSTTFREGGHLPSSFASPLFLLVLSIIYGIVFMVCETLHYETSTHGTRAYTRRKYSSNVALGFSCLICFGLAYAWLIVLITGHQ